MTDTRTPDRVPMTWYKGEVIPRSEYERIKAAEDVAPTRPQPTPTKYAAVPAAMREAKRWVTWQYEIRDGKRTKVPHTPGKGQAKSTDPATWVAFEEACQAEEFYTGIGFVLGDG